MKRKTLLVSLVFLLLGTGMQQDDASKKDRERLQGDWAGVSMIQDGMKLPDDDAQAYFRTYKGDKYAVFRYSEPLAKWTFTLDATKNPKTIDARREGDDKGKPALGIYEFEGGKLKLCVAGISKERPTKFESKAGSGHTLSVWEREKKGGKV